jgi:hypothetical protein
MQAAAEDGTQAVCLLGRWQEYKYPLAFLRRTHPALKIFYIDVGGDETNLDELAALATHHVLLALTGELVKVDVSPNQNPHTITTCRREMIEKPSLCLRTII